MRKFKLSGKRYEEIKEIVIEMFEKYQISCIPISGFEIATRMGVKVVPYSAFGDRIRSLMIKKSEDGFTKNDCGEYTIYYNEKKGYGRINNTIMHEISHIVLGHLEESEIAEAEANFFAKYALAPPALIHKLKLSSPEEIEEYFEVSSEASYYAYEYYQKWLAFGCINYTAYEIRTLELFKEVV